MMEDKNMKCKVSIEGTPDVPEAYYTDFIFLNKDGACLHQGTINKCIKRIIRDANVEAMDKDLVMLPPFSCHTFRSTYITRCAEKWVPVEITMKQVGHDDKKTTLKIYTTVHPDWQRRELTAMEDMFE
jgi:integrase